MNPFCGHPAVRRRLMEFMGGGPHSAGTAVYLTHTDGCLFDRHELRPLAELDWFIERDLDVARSIADSASYLVHLDMEYVNFDSPGAAYTDPVGCFERQEPVVKAIQKLLLEWGIRPLHVLTGQGHHFVWRIARDSDVARRIRALNPAPELTAACLERVPPAWAGKIDADDQATFAAIGLLVEYMAHRIKERAAPESVLPVELTALHVGPSARGHREMISVDISEYGDPLYSRVIRMPFTLYRKPTTVGDWGNDSIPAFRTVPLHEIDFRQAIQLRRTDREVLDLAERACVRIPQQEEGTAALLDEYLSSRLRQFHEMFYGARHDPRESWPHTYERTPLAHFPGCVRHLLTHPNDLLLKPTGMQLVTRYLLAEDWHPRHIAGLIRSKFENPQHGWGVNWGDYEAATRADFYVRLFSGLHLTGVDRLVDFNCVSTREKNFCFLQAHAHCSLEAARHKLLSNLHHE